MIIGMKIKLKVNIGKLSIILIAVFALLIAADLLTKFFEEKYLWELIIIKNFAEISGGKRNPGCAFSFLDENPQVGQPVLITFTFVLLAILIFFFIVLPERFTVLKIAITLVCSGAVGNLVDRLMFFSVRDWFGLNMFGMMTYCNLADFFIVIGTVLAVIDLLFLNEWAIIPLTKTAKAAQKARAEAERKEKETKAQTADAANAPSQTPAAAENLEAPDGGENTDGDNGE